jgi:proline iminopeptidase
VATFTTSDGVELFYDLQGSGRRVFALAGGPANDYRYLAEDLAPLADELELVYHDYRGSGRSADAPPETYTFERLSQDLDELRECLGDDQIVVLGHSMGGFLAQAYAGRYPKRCDGLVLAGTYPTMVPRRMLPPTFRALGWARSLKMAARALWWLAAFSWRPRTSEGRRRLYGIWSTMQEGRAPIRAREVAREHRLGIPLKNDNVRRLQRAFTTLDFSPLLPTIPCPVLVVYGERDAAAVAGATTYRAKLANLEVRALPGIGHDVFFEAPVGACDIVRAFLEVPTRP